MDPAEVMRKSTAPHFGPPALPNSLSEINLKMLNELLACGSDESRGPNTRGI
jgi:hypothetical protein